MDLLIRNGTVAESRGAYPADILVRDGRIAAMGQSLPVPAGAQVYDAAGRYILPGLIDAHVHFRDPGLTYKETLPPAPGRPSGAASPGCWTCPTWCR